MAINNTVGLGGRVAEIEEDAGLLCTVRGVIWVICETKGPRLPAVPQNYVNRSFRFLCFGINVEIRSWGLHKIPEIRNSGSFP